MVNPQLVGYDTINRATLITNIWKKEEEFIVLTREKESEITKKFSKITGADQLEPWVPSEQAQSEQCKYKKCTYGKKILMTLIMNRTDKCTRNFWYQTKTASFIYTVQLLIRWRSEHGTRNHNQRLFFEPDTIYKALIKRWIFDDSNVKLRSRFHSLGGLFNDIFNSWISDTLRHLKTSEMPISLLNFRFTCLQMYSEKCFVSNLCVQGIKVSFVKSTFAISSFSSILNLAI